MKEAQIGLNCDGTVVSKALDARLKMECPTKVPESRMATKKGYSPGGSLWLLTFSCVRTKQVNNEFFRSNMHSKGQSTASTLQCSFL